jgi:dihydroxyacetone kinase-like protein
MDRMDRECVLKIVDAICQMTQDKKAYLTELDAAIGDADHGINMARGFEALRAKFEQMAGLDVGGILTCVGMTLVSEVGGAAGPLYGTAFIEAGKQISGKTEINQEEMIGSGDAALAGIKKRGRSDRGQKTMIDAIEPALDAFRSADSIMDGLRAAAEKAREGIEETVGMIAKKGRASYLGPRSIGHQDPGATSSALMIETAYEVYQKEGPKRG